MMNDITTPDAAAVKAVKPRLEAQVMLNHNSEPLIVFGRGRTKYHAIEAGVTVRLVALDTLRGLRPAERNGKPYPPKLAASFYLNHSVRDITKRAKLVLRGIVARKVKGA